MKTNIAHSAPQQQDRSSWVDDGGTFIFLQHRHSLYFNLQGVNWNSAVDFSFSGPWWAGIQHVQQLTQTCTAAHGSGWRGSSIPQLKLCLLQGWFWDGDWILRVFMDSWSLNKPSLPLTTERTKIQGDLENINGRVQYQNKIQECLKRGYVWHWSLLMPCSCERTQLTRERKGNGNSSGLSLLENPHVKARSRVGQWQWFPLVQEKGKVSDPEFVTAKVLKCLKDTCISASTLGCCKQKGTGWIFW